MKEENVQFTIKPDGTIEVDQIGYKGKSCVGDIDNILNALGKEKTKKQKEEFYQKEKTKLNVKRR